MKHKIFKITYTRTIVVETLVKAHTLAEVEQKFRDHDFMIAPKEIECTTEVLDLGQVYEVEQ